MSDTVFQQCGRVVKDAVIDGESDQHGRSLKPICVISFGLWERHFSALISTCGLNKHIEISIIGSDGPTKRGPGTRKLGEPLLVWQVFCRLKNIVVP